MYNQNHPEFITCLLVSKSRYVPYVHNAKRQIDTTSTVVPVIHYQYVIQLRNPLINTT